MFDRSPFAIVDADETIEQLLDRGMCVQRALRRLGFPDCTGCSVRFDETLAEAVLNYGLNLERVLMTLNAVLIKEGMLVSKDHEKERS